MKDVVVNLEDLLGYIRSDRIRKSTPDVDRDFSFHFYRSDPDQTYSKNNHQFLHLQLILRCLIDLHSNNRNDFIQFYRNLYKENKNELTNLNKFTKSYTADCALHFYFQNSFLSRLLNKTLETVHIDQLFLFRFFLSDLQLQFNQYRCKSPIRTYRKQLLSKTDFKHFQEALGSFISLNSFLVTQCQREKVVASLNETTDGYQTVLLEIDANSQSVGIQPFVSLKSLHLSSDNNEIVFMIGSIFRIDDVRCEPYGITVIQLTLCSVEQIDSNVFNSTFNQTLVKENDVDFIAYADVLLSIGKLDESEKYYQRALTELSSEQQVELARCYHGLGNVAMDKDKDDLSFEYHQKSLTLRKTLFDEQNVSLADSYQSLADLQRRKGNQTEALQLYHQALNIWKDKDIAQSTYKRAMCFNNIGCLYSEEKDFQKTLEYYEKALEIMQKFFPSNHLYLGQTYNNIGSTYRALEDYQNAIKYYQLALEIKSKILSSQHLSTAATLSNIAGVYEQINELKQALSFYEQAAAIYRQRLPPTHSDYLRIQTDIRRVSNKLKS